jgi:hypothetical protein
MEQILAWRAACLQAINYMYTLNICYAPDYVLIVIYDSPEYIHWKAGAFPRLPTLDGIGGII